MKLAVITWPINDIGGINSWTENFIKGTEATLFHGTNQKKYGCDPHKKVRRGQRYELLPGYHLSYHPDLLRESLETLEQFDTILFAHPSPHPTKANTSDRWKEFYRKPTARKITVFHDSHWDRSNAWMADMAEYCDEVIAAQAHFIDSVKRFSDKARWTYFPIDRRARKEQHDEVVIATQWLSIKNHSKLMPRLDEVFKSVQLYGDGQMYHKLEDLIWVKCNWDGHAKMLCNKESIHKYHAFQTYDVVMDAMARSRKCCDLSTGGMTNMTHWEPLTVGSISMIEKTTARNPHNQIPPDCYVEFDIDNVVEALNKDYDPKIADRGYKFSQVCSCREVAKECLRQSQ